MASSMGSKTIAVVGLGNMGLALGQTLQQSGTQVTGWNRTPNRSTVQKAVACGISFEPNLTTVLSKNNTILICVLDYRTINSLFTNEDASEKRIMSYLEGKHVINVTNGTPKQAREMSRLMHEQGRVRSYFDGSVMVTPNMVGTPASFLVVSGETKQDFFSNHFGHEASLVKPLGKWLYRGTDVGAAALFDLAALASMYGMFAGSSVMLALLKRQKGGGDVDEVFTDGMERNMEQQHGEPKVQGLTETVMVPFLRELVPLLGLVAESWDRQAWDENYGSPVGMMQIGLQNILEACEDEGVDGGPVRYYASLLEKAAAEYGEGCGLAAVGPLLMK